jgi:hypothetical protein
MLEIGHQQRHWNHHGIPFLDEVVCAVFDAIESLFSSFLSLSLKKQAA